jgi:predicted transcriptional regulator
MTIAALRRIQNEAKLTTRQILENVEFLLPSCTPVEIAARLDTTMEAIEKHYVRHGRPDLAQPFNNVVHSERRLQARIAQKAQQGYVDLWEQVAVQVTGDRDPSVPQAPGDGQNWLAAG